MCITQGPHHLCQPTARTGLLADSGMLHDLGPMLEPYPPRHTPHHTYGWPGLGQDGEASACGRDSALSGSKDGHANTGTVLEMGPIHRCTHDHWLTTGG